MLFNSALIFAVFLTGLSQAGQKFGPGSEEGPRITPVCAQDESIPFGKFDPVALTFWPTDVYGAKSDGGQTYQKCSRDAKNKLLCPGIKQPSDLHCCPNSHFMKHN
ncbi:hypothetical protein PGT21_001605 [Puccinia graminis f. sp. tritici]|uniref:Uncharacterized protein n=1 Tax=Puccinia graminis f. sp. tritici TaxID=56615 RepID=A0A5B0QWI6_PUCGR|nr:hypothetical protein PGT21_001605 [Puccinia graminis f. sp. tritici]KAA1127783.1 hypothetical protein PGTUg99_008079 [Puccinia graminis f. sp. tritici]